MDQQHAMSPASTGTMGKPQGEGAARIWAIDALRGLIIITMALDHANHFVAQKHTSGEYWGGKFPVYPDSLSFLTRLVTHLAAPGFFLLLGAGMVFFAHARRRADWSKGAITGQLILRGGFLIALQFLVVNRAWEFSPGGWELDIYAGVLFALGGTMILGSLLLWLQPRILLIMTVALVLGTEIATPAHGRWAEEFSTLSRLLLIPGGNLELWVNYPILPWLGLVVFGMACGHWLADDSQRAARRALIWGGVLIVMFFVLRSLDRFGNIRPRAGNTWVDFFNVVKYPPSITFSLLTTGVNLTVFGLFSRIGAQSRRFLQPLVVFGRVPLFFYLTHLFLYAGLGLWLAPNGTTITGMIPYWLLGLLILFPLCWWYGKLKGHQPARSILRFI